MLVKDLNLFTNAKININRLDVLLPSQQKKEFFISSFLRSSKDNKNADIVLVALKQILVLMNTKSFMRRPFLFKLQNIMRFLTKFSLTKFTLVGEHRQSPKLRFWKVFST